jgi:murein DD-endopeptidase MepM/ murein hydrolase activator NlpD
MKDFLKWLLALVVLVLICTIPLYGPSLFRRGSSRVQYEQNPNSGALTVGDNLLQCAAAPFIIPTAGWIGVLYDDSIFSTASHSGLDIFGLEGNGVTPVYAAYDGYLTRRPEWVSAVIIRHPEDPLGPGRQIWTYYAHMADAAGQSYIVADIPPGTSELEVKQGTLLGYQGDYNNTSLRSIDTHLHFSIVLDDGSGNFRNETDIANTIDPSPYLGMRLNSLCGDRPPVCRPDVVCP